MRISLFLVIFVISSVCYSDDWRTYRQQTVQNRVEVITRLVGFSNKKSKYSLPEQFRLQDQLNPVVQPVQAPPLRRFAFSNNMPEYTPKSLPVRGAPQQISTYTQYHSGVVEIPVVIKDGVVITPSSQNISTFSTTLSH